MTFPRLLYPFFRAQGPTLGLAALVFAGLYFISRFNYLLFHTLAEFFTIVTAFTIFVLAWNARRYLNNGYLVFLGLALLCVAGIDLLHTLAYRGMGVFPTDANLPTQLWLAQRYLLAVSLLAAPLFFNRPLRTLRELTPVLLALVGVSGLLLLSIFVWHSFPAAFIEGQGLTPFKITSEWVISALLLAGGLLLLYHRRQFHPAILRLLLAALTLNIIAELIFTTYLRVDDIRNLIGHFFQLAGFYLIYKAVIETGFLIPQRLMFHELAAANEALRAREAELLESESRYRRLFETLIEGFVLQEAVTGGDGQVVDLRLVEMNRAFEEIAGRPREQLIGCTLREALPDLAPRWLPRLASVTAEGGSIRFEDENPRTGRCYEVKAYQPAPLRCAVLVEDVTEQRRGQEALRQSEARLRRLVESNIIGILYSNDDGSILMTNDAFLDMLGLTRQDFEAGLVNWVRLTPPEYLGADLNSMAEARAQGACTPYEKEFIHASGRRVPVLIGYAYFPEAAARYITFVLDLTGRKQAETRLENYALQLERSNRELQEFAFVASHDLQEPLRKIQAFGERLKKGASDQLGEDSALYLERMIAAAGRMRAMVDDLLTLSRITTRGRPFELVDLNAVGSEVLSDLELRLQATGGQVQMSRLPKIEADPTQIHQLLQNLIGNALKFHREGVPPIVKVYSQLDELSNEVKIVVEDNGIGFEEAYRERIFQPFQRLHGLGKYDGSGIGLAICRKIVERHAGKITAHSRPGEGSTFIVALPIQQRV